jgi:hypothetical protein
VASGQSDQIPSLETFLGVGERDPLIATEQSQDRGTRAAAEIELGQGSVIGFTPLADSRSREVSQPGEQAASQVNTGMLVRRLFRQCGNDYLGAGLEMALQFARAAIKAESE